MARYKRKPVIVEARQFTGGESNGNDLVAWLKSIGVQASWWAGMEFKRMVLPEQLAVYWEDALHLTPGDWITKQGKVLTRYTNEEFNVEFELLT